MSSLESVREEEKKFEGMPQFLVAKGIAIGIGVSISIAFLAVVFVWLWSPGAEAKATSAATDAVSAAKPIVLSTVYAKATFMPLSESAVKYGLNKPAARALIEHEMFTHSFFVEETLKSHTKYVPRLRVSTDLNSVVTLASGSMKVAVVQLLNDDGGPGRYGLLSFDEYEEDMAARGQ
jgi:hypothetical protein